jgi:hypothetical protein
MLLRVSNVRSAQSFSGPAKSPGKDHDIEVSF